MFRYTECIYNTATQLSSSVVALTCSIALQSVGFNRNKNFSSFSALSAFFRVRTAVFKSLNAFQPRYLEKKVIERCLHTL